MNEIKKLAKACDIKWPEDVSSRDTFQMDTGSSKRKVQNPEKDTSKNRSTSKRQKSEKSPITQPTIFTMNQPLSSPQSLQELDMKVDDELSDGSRSGDTNPNYDQIPPRDRSESNASATTVTSPMPTSNTSVATANSDKASPCRVCGKFLSTSTNRNRHENSTHGEKVKCELCGREGRWRSDYIKKHREACERRRN
ncbi:hypothetical protein EX30DRAFT_158349 [Ascodesmis nigricans]|uniref:C2H2-type domain-containing protein n=1 Tax=Ascodesmis nigricans TaxID=341454 RepID=A0A4S2MRG5_9PEZI|nr:hypothetical protein EX30DRAFT_158349 [Ascodesmis nigricans]